MKREKKVQRKEFEESYFFFSTNYQFVQFLLYTNVTLIDFSGRVAGPTLEKPSLWISSQRLKEVLWGQYRVQSDFHMINTKVFSTQTDLVTLLCRILYALWIKFLADHFLLHFPRLLFITYSPLLRAQIFFISGIYYTQAEITDAQWQPGHNHE